MNNYSGKGNRDRAREREREKIQENKNPKWCTKQSLTTYQTVPVSPLTAHSLLLSVCILSLMFYGRKNPFDCFRSAVLLLCSLTTSCVLAHWQREGNGELLGLGWALLRNNKNIGVLSKLFSYWNQNTALYCLVGGKLTLSQPKVGYPPMMCMCELWESISLTVYLLLSLLDREKLAVSFFLSVTCLVLKHPKHPYSSVVDSITTCQNLPCTANFWVQGSVLQVAPGGSWLLS